VYELKNEVDLKASNYKLPKPSDFSGRKNRQHAFLRRGSKAVGPMSQICRMLKIPSNSVKLAI
jgi:hypothetical protein